MNIIKELRKKKNIQQKELAIAIGVAQPTVSEWESGKKDPSGERLRKLAEFFGVDELVILGKGVVDLTEEVNTGPKTVEARIVSFGMDKLPKEQREQILGVVRAMFSNHPELFENGQNKSEGQEGTDDDDSKL